MRQVKSCSLSHCLLVLKFWPERWKVLLVRGGLCILSLLTIKTGSECPTFWCINYHLWRDPLPSSFSMSCLHSGSNPITLLRGSLLSKAMWSASGSSFSLIWEFRIWTDLSKWRGVAALITLYRARRYKMFLAAPSIRWVEKACSARWGSQRLGSPSMGILGTWRTGGQNHRTHAGRWIPSPPS